MRLTHRIATLALGASVAVGLGASAAAADSHVTHQSLVSSVPAAYTPNVNDGAVLAMAQTGSTVVIGGSFTSISPATDSSTVYPVQHIAAFTAGSGDIVTSFVPQLNGNVNALLAGPTDGTVYAGGDFTTVDGQTAHPFHLALLDISTGAVVAGWSLPSFGGPANGTTVNSLARANGRLFVGGTFTSVNGYTRQGLVAIRESAGTIDLSYSTPSFTGHHSYNRLCDPTKQTCAPGFPGITALDVNPAGTRLVATGDFNSVGNATRDQLALLNLGSTAATTNANWSTDAYTSPCIASAFDSYIRGVQFSPDGSYFVVTATGGSGKKNDDGTTARCDSAARFETAASSADVPPTWVDYTGHDTLLSVAITGPVVYVGGHERWLNNSNGADNAGTGAVPRPGMAALDPVNGMPLAWNPGRNPRGAGAFALLATADGLYVGSDTDRIGPGPSDPADTYIRDKVAFFPLTGGAALGANQATPLPGLVYQLGTPTDTGTDNGAVAVPWGGEAPPGDPISVTGVDDWVSGVRGAFDINGTVYYGDTDGSFYKRAFDGATFGDAEAIDPYHDPIWDGVVYDSDTGGTYDGNPSGFYATIPSLTSLFYSNGRVYYTLAGDTHMYWRWFEPDSGVVGADVFQTTDTNDWSNVDGAFVSDSTLFFADASTGVLKRIGFSAGEPSGGVSIADASRDWRSHGAFVLKANSTTDLVASPSGSTRENQPITLTATVALAADPSTHPAGTVTFYDGTTPLNSTPIEVDSSTGEEQFEIQGLPPSAPGHTVLSATFRSTDGTVNDSSSAPIAYTVDPVATTPTVSGAARVGTTDTCNEPTHDGETAGYTWTADGHAVATGKVYTIGAVALHRALGCTAAVSVGKGPSSTARSAVRKVARGPVLAVRSKPRLHGHHKVGTTERVSLGKWKPAASSYNFQWYAGTHKIHHGTARRLKLTKRRAGKRIRCVVTAHRAGFANGHATSNRVKVTR